MSSYACIPIPVPQSYESLTKYKGPVGPSSSFPTACYATHSLSHLPHYVPTACLLITVSCQVPTHLFPHIMFPLLVTWPLLLLLHVTHCNALRPIFPLLVTTGCYMCHTMCDSHISPSVPTACYLLCWGSTRSPAGSRLCAQVTSGVKSAGGHLHYTYMQRPVVTSSGSPAGKW